MLDGESKWKYVHKINNKSLYILYPLGQVFLEANDYARLRMRVWYVWFLYECVCVCVCVWVRVNVRVVKGKQAGQLVHRLG